MPNDGTLESTLVVTERTSEQHPVLPAERRAIFQSIRGTEWSAFKHPIHAAKHCTIRVAEQSAFESAICPTICSTFRGTFRQPLPRLFQHTY
jgi:hypothetical protein